jgi:hypothetical protein
MDMDSVSSDSDFEHFLALVPVAGAKLVGLQGIENAQDFLGIAAHGKIVDGNEPNHIIGIDDESGALGHAFGGIEAAPQLVLVLPIIDSDQQDIWRSGQRQWLE